MGARVSPLADLTGEPAMRTTDMHPVRLPTEKAEEVNAALERVRGHLFERRDLSHIRVTAGGGDIRGFQQYGHWTARWGV